MIIFIIPSVQSMYAGQSRTLPAEINPFCSETADSTSKLLGIKGFICKDHNIKMMKIDRWTDEKWNINLTSHVQVHCFWFNRGRKKATELSLIPLFLLQNNSSQRFQQ